MTIFILNKLQKEDVIFYNQCNAAMSNPVQLILIVIVLLH